jgi:A-factor type gamma-butyrolactone 1'-reductase (1S-forming)
MATGNYVVVGGTSGIGRAAVRRLASDGATVVFCGRNTGAGNELCRELGETVRFLPADITRKPDVTMFFDAVRKTLPTVDGVFNAAGVIGVDSIMRGTRFHESSEENFDSVFAVNVKGIWRCLQHELHIMAAQGKGAIVNCASVAGLRAADSLSVSYTASKHALVGMTRALAAEYARDRIRINAICPGVIDTEMLQGLHDQLLADLRTKNPAARIGTPEEVADVVEFLLSDKSSYVNGAVLTIDAGGLTGAR